MSDKLQTKIDGQKMSKGGSTLDSTALMVPAVGVSVMVVLMAVFYMYYRRKQNRHHPRRHHRESIRAEKPSPAGRRRPQTLAEAGGLPPARPSGKEVSS